MAQVKSGALKTGEREGRYLTFTWYVTKTDAANNYTDIKWSLTGGGVGGYVTCGNFHVSIDDDVVFESSTRIDVWVTTTIAQGTKRIYHNEDGSKTFNAWVEAGIYEVAVNSVGTMSWELPTLVRNAKITSFSVSPVDETSVKYNFSADSTCDYAWYSIDDGANWYALPTSNIVSGLSANTTYNFKLRLRKKDTQLTTDSATYQQTTYNYPHCTNSPDFTIGDPLTLELYNPLGREVRITGYAKSDGSQIFAGTTTSTSLTGFNVDDENGGATVQYKSIPNAQSGAYRVVVSYGNKAMERDAGNVYKIRGNEVPTINAFDYIDTNNDVVAITGDATQIVQNKSTLQARFNSATANFGAGGISSYHLECNGIKKDGTSSGSYDFGTINSARDVDLKLTVYDSRGLSASKTLTVKMVAYEKPKATVELKRLNNYEDETYLTVDGSVSSVLNKNTMTIQYRYKASGGEYGSFAPITDREKQTLSLNKNNSYVFNVVVADALRGTFDAEYVLNKGVFPLFIDTVKNSVGVNRFPQYEKSLEMDGLLVTNTRETLQAEIGKTVEITLGLNGGYNGTALVNIRIMGANLEIARLYYAFRSTQYFGIATPITELSYNNTSSLVPCEVQNTVAGLKFRLTNNHSSEVSIRYSIIELC